MNKCMLGLKGNGLLVIVDIFAYYLFKTDIKNRNIVIEMYFMSYIHLQ